MMNSLETTRTMAQHLGRWVLAACFLLMTGQVLASTLKSLNYVTLPGNKLQLQLTFDGTPPQTKGYSIEKPARIAIDLLGATSDLKTKYHSLGTGNARSVTVVQAKDRSRMIIDLMRLVGYKVDAKGDQLLVTLGESSTPANDASVAPAEEVANGAAPAVDDIDFHRSPQGGGDVVIKLSNPAIPVDVEQQNGQVVATFSGAALPQNLRRRLDVTDFGTVVQYVDAKTNGTNSVISITANGQWDYLAYQTNDTFTINVKAKGKENENANKQAFQYTGQKLSLDFQDIDVRSVLQLIADFTNLNLVASDSVHGKITLRLKNVPWDQALDLILKAKGLAKRKVGNVLMVGPADEMAAREKAELQDEQQREQLEPLKTDFIRINYAKAKDIASLLKAKGSFLSSRGMVTVDDRTNTLIVQDTTSRLDTIRNMITTLDVPVQQVLIEARVVIASSDVANSIGVRWGGQVFHNSSNGSSLLGSGQAAGLGNTGTSASFGDANNMVVDLGIPDAGTSHFSLGYFSQSTGLLELELSALDSEGKAQILATPKVLTADQQQATIASGQEIPYSTTSNGGTNVQFKNAELKLEVTPHITPDNHVIMDITVNDDSPGGTATNGEIIIDTNQVKTSVLVDDGETVVLGGIFQHQQSHSVVKTPFLGDLPWIGNLFRQKLESDKKQELLIFITPRLVKKNS
jgi:type IV pilus assembly protein PilQ